MLRTRASSCFFLLASAFAQAFAFSYRLGLCIGLPMASGGVVQPVSGVFSRRPCASTAFPGLRIAVEHKFLHRQPSFRVAVATGILPRCAAIAALTVSQGVSLAGPHGVHLFLLTQTSRRSISLVTDCFARNDQLNSSVHLAAGCVIVCSNRVRVAKPFRRDRCS